MAQQQACELPSGSSSTPSPFYLHSLPSWVLEDFCQKMDCLNDYDWMRFDCEPNDLLCRDFPSVLFPSEKCTWRKSTAVLCMVSHSASRKKASLQSIESQFLSSCLKPGGKKELPPASHVITDQTELRKIKCMGKTGISITRELMWWWGVRLATVQQLLGLLQELELYQAAQVITDWKSLTHNSVRAPLKLPEQKKELLHPSGNKNKEKKGNEIEVPLAQLHRRENDPVLRQDVDILPLFKPPTSMDLPHSLQSNLPGLLHAKFCSTSIPQQEASPNHDPASLLWMPEEIQIATSGFKEENQISEGIFATSYRCQRNNTMYVVKKLKENNTQRFFRTEVQICFRCCHPNILLLLGFCVESGLHCLIYPYLQNGSLMDRLQCQDGSDALTWEQRTRISLGLIQAIQHLHHFGIIHGNIKSSNVLLDANFAPQLGHSGLRLYPVEKKSEYAVIKTKVLQASLAYFPEDFIRHGQLTEKVDIFSCGIVLAEILTGMKAVDERRNPILLKDVLLEEIQVAKELSCAKERTFERFAAVEICRKYQDKLSVCLPEVVAVCLATSVCICLRKKNTDLAEVSEMMEIANHQVRCQNVCESSRNLETSVNTPEETNDEPASFFSADSYGQNGEGQADAGSLNCAAVPSFIRVLSPETYSEQMLRIPCESDESGNFLSDVICCPPSNNSPESENPSFTKPVIFIAKNMGSDRNTNQQEKTVSSVRENNGLSCSSQDKR